MPEQETIDIPTPVGGNSDDHSSEERDVMTPEQVSNQLGAQLMQSGNIAQNNFITVQKMSDYDYMENKRMVTLDESVGIREVQSEKNPGGPSKP